LNRTTQSHAIVREDTVCGRPYVARNVNPFDGMFQPVNFANMIPIIIDMLDQTVGRLKNPLPKPKPTLTADIQIQIQRGYAFVAMPMDENNHELRSTLRLLVTGRTSCASALPRMIW